MIFDSRKEAGFLLAKKLRFIKPRSSIVLGIPRGGVVVAKEVSDKLSLPLDLIVVKKIGSPGIPELALGAIAPEGVTYWDEKLCKMAGVGKNQKSKIKSKMAKERKEREKRLRRGKVYDFKDKTIILVDDGIATGATVLAARKYLKTQKIKNLILAVPVISKEILRAIEKYFDKVIALSIEEDFMAVGQFYRFFPQVTDEEVIDIMG